MVSDLIDWTLNHNLYTWIHGPLDVYMCSFRQCVQYFPDTFINVKTYQDFFVG